MAQVGRRVVRPRGHHQHLQILGVRPDRQRRKHPTSTACLFRALNLRHVRPEKALDHSTT